MLQLKSLFLGSEKVGKTSIIKQYCEGMYSDSYQATHKIDFMVHESKSDGLPEIISEGVRHTIYDAVAKIYSSLVGQISDLW